MSKSITLRNIEDSPEFFKNIFIPYTESLRYIYKCNSLINANKRFKNYTLADDINKPYKNIMGDFARILSLVNYKCSVEKYNDYHYNIVILVKYTTTMPPIPISYDVKLYADDDDYIITVPFGHPFGLKQLPGYYKCKFEKEVCFIYTKNVIDVLLGCYTYEQFERAVSVRALLPDIWKIVYSYVILG